MRDILTECCWQMFWLVDLFALLWPWVQYKEMKPAFVVFFLVFVKCGMSEADTLNRSSQGTSEEEAGKTQVLPVKRTAFQSGYLLTNAGKEVHSSHPHSSKCFFFSAKNNNIQIWNCSTFQKPFAFEKLSFFLLFNFWTNTFWMLNFYSVLFFLKCSI